MYQDDDLTKYSIERQGPPMFTNARMGVLFVYAVIATIGIVFLAWIIS